MSRTKFKITKVSKPRKNKAVTGFGRDKNCKLKLTITSTISPEIFLIAKETQSPR